jgi:hypothetical protein
MHSAMNMESEMCSAMTRFIPFGRNHTLYDVIRNMILSRRMHRICEDCYKYSIYIIMEFLIYFRFRFH